MTTRTIQDVHRDYKDHKLSEEKAVEEICSLVHTRILRMGRRLRIGYEAEDVVQDVMEAFHEHRMIDADSLYMSWFIRAASNKFTDIYRSRRASPFISTPVNEIQRWCEPIDPRCLNKEIENNAVLYDLFHKTPSVSDLDRNILLMRYEGARFSELAKIHGLTPGAIKVRTYRALEKLHETTRKKLPPSSGNGAAPQGGREPVEDHHSSETVDQEHDVDIDEVDIDRRCAELFIELRGMFDLLCEEEPVRQEQKVRILSRLRGYLGMQKRTKARAAACSR